MRPTPDSALYAERLSVPLRWWALGTMFLASMLLAFLVSMPLALAAGSALVLAAAMVALFVGYGAARIIVGGSEVVAGQARIDVSWLADPVALDIADTKRAVGVEADARAYLLLRPYLKRSVRVQLTDPGDPAPYWLLSTRHPRMLAAAIDRAIKNERASH